MLIVNSQSPYRDQMSYLHLIGTNCVRWGHFGKLGKRCVGTSKYYYYLFFFFTSCESIINFFLISQNLYFN